MASVYVPNYSLTSTVVGTTTINNPTLLLRVNGITYANGYRVDYAGAYQNYFPAKDGTNILLYCYTVVFGQDLGQTTLPNVEVLVASPAIQTAITGDTTDITNGLGIGGQPYPVLVSSTSFVASTANTIISSTITVPPDGLMLLTIAREFPSASATSVTDSYGNSWTKLGESLNVTGFNGSTQAMEIWYAKVSYAIPSDITTAVTITYPTVFDDFAGILSVWRNTNRYNPIYLGGIVGNNTIGSTPSVTFSTDTNYSTVVYVASTAFSDYNLYLTDWNNLGASLNGGAAYWQWMYSSWKYFSSTQTSLTVSPPGNTANSGNITAAVILRGIS